MVCVFRESADFAALVLLDPPIVFQRVEPSRSRRGPERWSIRSKPRPSPLVIGGPKPKGPSPTADEAVCSREAQKDYSAGFISGD